MLFVALERNRVGHFVGRGVDLHRQVQFAQDRHRLFVKLRHALRLELEVSDRAVAFQDAQFVIDEIETDLERVERHAEWAKSSDRARSNKA